MANIFVRLCNGEKAKECLDLLLRFCTGTNLFTYHNDWRNMGVTLKYMHAGHAPFQIDANMGFTAAVYEMLMYSDETKIKLLPALPNEWSNGEITNLKVRGGISVSIKWDEGSAFATIYSERDCEINVCAPVGYKLEGGAYESSDYGDRFIRLKLKNGDAVSVNYVK